MSLVKILSYQYISGYSYNIDRRPGLYIGQVIDEKTGATVIRGGNGSWVIGVPAQILIKVGTDPDTDYQTFNIRKMLKAYASSLSRNKLTQNFARAVCEWLLGKEVEADDVIGNIHKLLWDNSDYFSI